MRFLKDLKVQNKRVIVRADLNVPLENGQITNDFRLQATLPTLKYLINQKAKIVLISHLGRPKGVDEKYSLRPVSRHLEKLLGRTVQFIDDCVGQEAQDAARKLEPGQVILLENVRFHPEETANDPDFAKKLAGLGEIYVNDSFGVNHRSHASLVGVPQYLPGYAGFLLKKEIEILTKVLNKPERPLAVIIGGAKISTKIKVIESFLDSADNIVLGGALANTIISAKGLSIGKSVSEEGMVEEVKKLKLTNNKLHIPVDVIVSADLSGRGDSRITPVGKMEEDEMILDIGPNTVGLYGRVIAQAKTVIWSGPMGLFEVDQFSKGSKGVAQAVARGDGFSVVGGGDTIALLGELSLLDKMNHICTGGGAMLKFLTKEDLPAIKILK